MGKAGLVLGIIGLVFSFSIFTPLYVLLFGFAVSFTTTGLTVSGVSFYQARKAGTSRKIPIAGLAVGVVGLAPIVWLIIAVLLAWLGGWES